VRDSVGEVAATFTPLRRHKVCILNRAF